MGNGTANCKLLRLACSETGITEVLEQQRVEQIPAARMMASQGEE